MNTFTTKYGELQGVSRFNTYPDGSLQDCTVSEFNELNTPHGTLIPQYEDSGERRKHIRSLSFYSNGILKSISLQDQTPIQTSLGTIPAESILFHEDGSLKRIFPLNGKLTGYWSEENEYSLAEEFSFDFSFGAFKQKVIGIQFYEDGSVKSLTFWPKDKFTIQSPVGEVMVRTGIALHPNGALKSLEPYIPTAVKTPIGTLRAYDPNPIGVHGDINSLKFTEDGALQGVTTSANTVEVTDKAGNVKAYKPTLKPSLLHEEGMDLYGLQIEFLDNKVRFNKSDADVFDLTEYSFSVQPFVSQDQGGCSPSACASCSGCV